MDWNKLADKKILEETFKALKDRGIEVMVVNDRKEALEKIKELIPNGAEVMNGSSATLREIGFVDYLKLGKHGWNNLHDPIFAEKDQQKQGELRTKSTLAEYYLGSVHAISSKGEVLVASASGSQLPAYVFSSPHVIWVAGINKITEDLDSAIKRVREYVLPLENERMKKEGFPGSFIGKLVIFEKEMMPGRITLVLVKEKLGF